MLEPSRIWRDPASGRVVIEERDDRDTGFPITTSQPFSVVGFSTFVEFYREPLIRARRGQLVINAGLALTGAFVGTFAAVEVNIIGLIGGSPVFMMETMLDANVPSITFDWDEPETLSAIAIEGRQNVDGLPSSATVGITTLNFSVAGTYWR